MRLGDIPYELHPEVWVLTVGAVALGWYAWAILQPKAIAIGYTPIKRSQACWYISAVFGLWVVSSWPIHEIAEQHLYFVHMLQHLLISMILPAVFLLAAPTWLLELLIPRGSSFWTLSSWLANPIRAAVIFNGLTILLHWSLLVQLSYESATLHFIFHLVIFLAGIVMWIPVIGPFDEWKIPPMAQCIFLFVNSIVPTVPSGWLIFAEEVVYRHYDTADRLWGIDVLVDQQAAGVVMKLVGGFFLWFVIAFIWFRWAFAEMRADGVTPDSNLVESSV